jgi:phosphate-selective porin OprO/OprP
VTSPVSSGRARAIGAIAVVVVIAVASARTMIAQVNGAASSASAAAKVSSPSVEERLAELDQQIRILKRLRELERDSAAAEAKGEARATAGRQGFLLRSADGRFQLRLGGNVQADGRLYASDGVPSLGNTFLLRRVRPILEVTAYRVFEVRVMPDFAEGRVQLQDAYVGARLLPGIQVRAGKFKGPVSLERLQSQADLLFIERAFPSSIAPNRDLGVSLGGDLFGGRVRYDVGVFDGTVDGGNTDGDAGDNKDGHARLFFTPFARSGGFLTGLGIGVAGTLGEEHGSLTAPALAAYRSEGQNVFFSYRADGTAPNTAVADGRRTRIAPQLSYLRGPFGLLGEWIRSTQVVNRAGALATISIKAWQATGSLAVTGDQASFTGLAPRRPVTEGGAGALELVVRYAELGADEEAFPVFADPARSARRAREWGVGLNWYLERRVKIAANYLHTTFDGGATTGDREDENAILTRFQVAF